jgi:hypothetical protein
MAKKTPEPTMIPSETDLAWAAGIIDGEGCIMVKVDSQTIKRSGWTRHELMLVVPNTNEPMIRKLQAMFGGGFSVRPKRGLETRRIAQWAIYGFRAANCLRQVTRYMVAKRDEAILGLEMAATLIDRHDYNANSGQGAPRPTVEVIARRQAIREELQRLKRIEYTFADFQEATK